MATRTEIRSMIVERLAQLKRTTTEEMEIYLRQAEGKEDSHRLVRTLPKLRRRLGIKLPPRPELRAVLGSVEELTDYVFQLAKQAAA